MKDRLSSFLAALGLAYVAWLIFGPETAGIVCAAIITGSRATAATQGVLAASRVVDMSDRIHLLDPNMAPLTALTMKLRGAVTRNPKFDWLEDDYLPSSDTINGAKTAGDLTITVDNGGRFRVNDVIKYINSGEVMHVTGVSGNDLTVTRNDWATAAGALDDAATLLIIGNANNEGADVRTVKSQQKTNVFNYTQIFRWPFGATRTLQGSDLYGGPDLPYQTKIAGREHRIQIERAYWFGEKYEDVTGQATPIRFTDGVFARIATNVTTVSGGTLTIDVMETFLRSAFRYGSGRKIFFVSRAVNSYINLIATTKIQTVPSSKSFPLALTEYISTHGKVYLVSHNLFEGAGTNQAYGGWGACLDMDAAFHRYLANGKTHIRQNIQNPGIDGRTDEYLSECGLMLANEAWHAVMKNVSSYT